MSHQLALSRHLIARLSVLTFLLCLGCARTGMPTSGAPLADAPARTGVAGKVLARAGTPAAGAWVFAYRSARSGLRGPADFAAEVAADGSYFLDLVEGSYHLVARWRSGGGEVAGPPRPGDAWSPFRHNPVHVEPGQVSRADFRLVGITQPLILRQGTLVGGETGFTGRVVDGRGLPVPGAIVLAYRSADFRRMPDFTAPAADEEGRFTLYLPEAGRYCLAVRAHPRGQPRAGEPFARIGGASAECPLVAAGEIVDLGTIVLKPYRP